MKARKFIANNLLMLIIIGVAFIMIFPFLWMLSTALKSDEELVAHATQLVPDRPAFSNFPKAWTAAPFTRMMFNSIFVSTVITFFVALISALTGFAFAKYQFRGRNLLFALFLSGIIIPGQVTMIPVFIIVRNLGWLNSYWGLIMPALASPFGMFLMRQYIQTVPTDLVEAARIDGSSEYGIFWRIILPLIKPPLAVVSIFTFMGSWNNFLWPLIILNSPEMYTIQLGLARFTSEYFVTYNLLMAASLLSIVPIFIVFALFQRQFVEGIALTGLKG